MRERTPLREAAVISAVTAAPSGAAVAAAGTANAACAPATSRVNANLGNTASSTVLDCRRKR